MGFFSSDCGVFLEVFSLSVFFPEKEGLNWSGLFSVAKHLLLQAFNLGVLVLCVFSFAKVARVPGTMHFQAVC